MRDGTIRYYEENAETFIAGTVSVDFKEIQEKFLSRLSSDARILDFGCGSGRDAKCFKEAGYRVEASDGSETLCILASGYAGIPVKHMLFSELDEEDRYDGIWACSSILHLPFDELGEVLQKMARALKREGVIYTSFKYGTFEGGRNGRYFTDMTEERFETLMAGTPELKTEEQWITSDVRPGRGKEQWLNLIIRKI